MRKYNKAELKHLKWKLINQDGLNPSQADKRIDDLINFEKDLDRIKKKESIDNKKTIKQNLDLDMKRLRNL